MRNLLLISNSTMYGGGYLDHCEKQMREFLNNKKSILFIPYARPSGKTWDEITNIAHEKFKTMGVNLKGIQEYTDEQKAIENAEVIFVCGGNTFVLLQTLYDKNLVDIIKERVNSGIPYIGTSAGGSIAGKTIMTSNDMPIFYPPSFKALEFVPFIFNMHYIDADPNSKHMGETREIRIKEYHVFNDDTVVGLREGGMLEVVDDKIHLKGCAGAKIFRKDKEPTTHQHGESLDFLLNEQS